MTAIVADTHALIWYLLGSDRLSRAALEAFSNATAGGHAIYIASISLVEVTYLVEKGLPEGALEQLEAAFDTPSSGVVPVMLDLAIAKSVRHIPRSGVPDLPDRVIAATAKYLGYPLVTCDKNIRACGIETIW